MVSIVDPPILSVPVLVSEQTQTVSIVPEKSEITNFKDCRCFAAFIITFSQSHPQTTLESARMIFEKHLKVFEPRFDRLFDSNDEPTGYFFDGGTFDMIDMKELITFITSED